jgi:uncharacterized membrane protein YoaK (UPF0700 family)
MPDTVHLGPAHRTATALLLTSVGGFVDAVGWLTLLQVFTANMSGNSIHVGMATGNLDFSTVRRFGCAIATYVGALILTRIALEIGARVGLRRIASLTFAIEALLLLTFRYVAPPLQDGQVANHASPAYLGMVALLAFAMGMQTATMTHIGSLTVYTTFVTGTLTKCAESVARVVFWMYDAVKAGRPLSHTVGTLLQQPDAVGSVFLLAVWICYIVGAATGTITKYRWGLRAMYFPVGVLMCLVVLDLIRPIAGKEERRQAEGNHQVRVPA